MDEVRTALDGFGGEQLVVRRDDELGLVAVIAIDSTTLGPALGGVRLARYAGLDAAATEARRLAAAMTLKNAAAELPLGGGKAVVVDHEGLGDRVRVMRRVGEFVAALGGSYVPGVDMNTRAEDLREMARAGAVVSCDEADPSPWTARGVHAAMRAAVAHADDGGTLDGLTILVQGAGQVGAALARRCAADGAEVLVADVRPDRAAALAAELGGRAIPASEVLATRCDVLAPCATARVVTASGAAALRCRIVAGAANDVLAESAAAEALQAAGVVAVPDFIANAGGVVHIAGVRGGDAEARIAAAVDAIGERTAEILAAADRAGITPHAVAVRRARARVAAAARRGAPPAEAVAA